MNLEEKQKYFEYRTPEDLRIHEQPFSVDEWNKKLERIGGHDPLGDQRMRIVWGGTAKKRAMAQTPTRSIEVMSIKYPGPIPRIRVQDGFTWFDGEGHSFVVKQKEQIPKGKLSVPNFEYFELGVLRWVLEMKYTCEELTALGRYPHPDSAQAKTFGRRDGRQFIPPMDPRGEYIGLYPLQTPDGKYFEPTPEWFEGLDKTRQYLEKATAGDRLVEFNRLNERYAQLEAKEVEEEQEFRDTIMEEAMIESEKSAKGKITFDMRV